MPAMNYWMFPLSLRISSLLGILGSVPIFPYFPYFPIFLYSPSISRRSPRLKVAESCCREISLSP